MLINLATTTTRNPPCAGAANRPSFTRLPSRLFRVTCLLRDGSRDQIDMISTTERGALLRVIEIHGDSLRTCHAREVLS